MKKRDINAFRELYVNQSEKCDCELPEFDHRDDYYLAMGQQEGDNFYVNAVHLYEKKSTNMRRALRAIRKKDNICAKKGVEVLTVNDDPAVSGEKKGRQRNSGKKKGKKASANENGATTTAQNLDDIAEGEMSTSSPAVDNGEGGDGAKTKGKGKNRKNKDKTRRNNRKKGRNGGQDDGNA